MASSVNPSIQRDLQQLEKMMESYSKFLAQLEEQDLPHHQRQATEAALVMLKELMVNKTRDVRRRLRETHRY